MNAEPLPGLGGAVPVLAFIPAPAPAPVPGVLTAGGCAGLLPGGGGLLTGCCGGLAAMPGVLTAPGGGGLPELGGLGLRPCTGACENAEPLPGLAGGLTALGGGLGAGCC